MNGCKLQLEIKNNLLHRVYDDSRNFIAIVSTVNCSATVVHEVASYFTPEKLRMGNLRRKLLAYLKRKNLESYQDIIKSLKLRG